MLFEGDQGAPFRFAGQEAGRAVDSIDDPSTAAGAADAELLAKDGVAGAFAQDLGAQGELDLLVSGADGTPVALGAPGGVPGGEVAQCDRVGGIRQTVREAQIGVDSVHAATGASRSASIPRSNLAPARTSATRRGAFTERQRFRADSMSLNVIAGAAAREPAPRVPLVRSRTVEKPDSIGFAVRRRIQCSAG